MIRLILNICHFRNEDMYRSCILILRPGPLGLLLFGLVGCHQNAVYQCTVEQVEYEAAGNGFHADWQVSVIGRSRNSIREYAQSRIRTIWSVHDTGKVIEIVTADVFEGPVGPSRSDLQRPIIEWLSDPERDGKANVGTISKKVIDEHVFQAITYRGLIRFNDGEFESAARFAVLLSADGRTHFWIVKDQVVANGDIEYLISRTGSVPSQNLDEGE